MTELDLRRLAEEAVRYADSRYSNYLQALTLFLIASLIVEIEVLAIGRANFTFFAIGIIPIYFLAPITIVLQRISKLRRRILGIVVLTSEIDEDRLERLVRRLDSAVDQCLVFLALGWAMLFTLFLVFTFLFGR